MNYLSSIDSTTSEGMLLVDKPIGVTSHDVVDWARRVTTIRKIGHAGTLDPLATGLLILLIGRKYTKIQSTFLKQNKSYSVSCLLGAQSETLDVLNTKATQKLRALPRSFVAHYSRINLVNNSISQYEKKAFTKWSSISTLSQHDIEDVLSSFVGEHQQQVPWFSAVKVQGQKLYEVGRRGSKVELERPSKTVTIHDLSKICVLRDTQKHIVKISMHVLCSSGTYVRALVRDIGVALGSTAVVTQLRRESIGSLSVSDAGVCPLL